MHIVFAVVAVVAVVVHSYIVFAHFSSTANVPGTYAHMLLCSSVDFLQRCSRRAPQMFLQKQVLQLCICVCLIDDQVHVILEHMDRGSLHDIIHKTRAAGPLPEQVIAAIFYQVIDHYTMLSGTQLQSCLQKRCTTVCLSF
jgi:serine/threonine protein kinase